MTLEVQTYAGYKPDERPLRFRLGDQWLEVEELLDRWYDPQATYFKVRASDGAHYVLKHDERADAWTLEAFRKL